MPEPNYEEVADCADAILLTLLQTSSISGDPARRRDEARALQLERNARLHAERPGQDTLWVLVGALARVPSRSNVLSLLLKLIDTQGPEAFWTVDYNGSGQLLRLEPFRRVEHLQQGEGGGE